MSSRIDPATLSLFHAYTDHTIAAERAENDATSETVKDALVPALVTLRAFGQVLDALPEVFA